jgi:hypothetical protein
LPDAAVICAHERCSNEFTPGPKAGRRRFCSIVCSNADYYVRFGDQKRQRVRQWRIDNPELARERSRINRANWYARGGWAKDEKRKRLEGQAARQRQREELFGT